MIYYFIVSVHRQVPWMFCIVACVVNVITLKIISHSFHFLLEFDKFWPLSTCALATQIFLMGVQNFPQHIHFGANVFSITQTLQGITALQLILVEMEAQNKIIDLGSPDNSTDVDFQDEKMSTESSTTCVASCIRTCHFGMEELELLSRSDDMFLEFLQYKGLIARGSTCTNC